MVRSSPAGVTARASHSPPKAPRLRTPPRCCVRVLDSVEQGSSEVSRQAILFGLAAEGDRCLTVDDDQVLVGEAADGGLDGPLLQVAEADAGNDLFQVVLDCRPLLGELLGSMGSLPGRTPAAGRIPIRGVCAEAKAPTGTEVQVQDLGQADVER